MFGHNSNTDDQAGAVQHGSDMPGNGAPAAFEPQTITPTAGAPVVDDSSQYPATDLPATAPPVDTVGDPASDTGAAPMVNPVDTSAVPATPPPVTDSIDAIENAPVVESTPPVVAAPATDSSSPVPGGSLLELKQSALHELSPLLGHLDQSPEEKFRTTMMMIQASDDHTMLQAAYDAAKAITDEKVRAQALLDVVNEINYFTQANSNGTEASQ